VRPSGWISPGRPERSAGLELAATVAEQELDLLAAGGEGEQVDRAVAGEVGDPQAGRAHAGGDGAGDELALTAAEQDVHRGVVAAAGGRGGGDREVEQAVGVEVGGLDRGRGHRELEAGGEAQAAAPSLMAKVTAWPPAPLTMSARSGRPSPSMSATVPATAAPPTSSTAGAP
jgi:hypothetical protein